MPLISDRTDSRKRTVAEAPSGNQLVQAHADTDQSRDNTNAAGWGWLPILSVTCASGLLLLALANAASRNADARATSLFWFGILVLVVPIAARLFTSRASRRERIGLIVMLGFALYFAKILHSPLHFSFVDELQHWRTADDIIQNRILFEVNPILPVSPYFPGLELLTTAVTNLTGLGIYEAGIIVLGAARLVFVLSLYLFYELISQSPRTAGIASLVYMCNQSFVYFSTVFAYESLALPLAALTIYVIASRAYARPQARLGLNLATVLGLGAVVITHHLTSYVLTVFLALWAIIVWIRSIVTAYVQRKINHSATSRLQIGQRNHRPTGYQEMAHKINYYTELTVIGRTALLAFVIGVGWLIFVASLTLNYLAMPFWNALTSLVRFINGELVSRILFQAGGYSAPDGERFVAYASVGLTVLMLPLGLYWIWKRYRAQNVALALTAVALIYPIILPFRLTNSGSLLSNRSIPFIFIAVAFVVAVGAIHLRHPRLSGWARQVILITGATILFTGGVVLGWPESWRLPGPFLVSSHTRSVESQGIAAAQWARAYLGPNNRMAADWINAHLMGSFGHQDMETGLIDGINVAPLFFSPSIGVSELEILQRGRIRYVVIDRRLSSMLPLTGWYVVELEPNANHYESPIDPALLEKFDSLTQVSRLFDGGDIVIYDVGNLVNAP